MSASSSTMSAMDFRRAATPWVCAQRAGSDSASSSAARSRAHWHMFHRSESRRSQAITAGGRTGPCRAPPRPGRRLPAQPAHAVPSPATPRTAPTAPPRSAAGRPAASSPDSISRRRSAAILRYCGTALARRCPGSATTRPRPGLDSISPSAASWSSARRTVLRATPNSAHSADSDGSDAPGANSPPAMRARRASAMALYAPHAVARGLTRRLTICQAWSVVLDRRRRQRTPDRPSAATSAVTVHGDACRCRRQHVRQAGRDRTGHPPELDEPARRPGPTPLVSSRERSAHVEPDVLQRERQTVRRLLRVLARHPRHSTILCPAIWSPALVHRCHRAPVSRPSVTTGEPRLRDVLVRLDYARLSSTARRCWGGLPVRHPLARALASVGLDAVDVAARLGVDPKTVQRWFAGRVPYPRHRTALADLTGWAVARPVARPSARPATDTRRRTSCASPTPTAPPYPPTPGTASSPTPNTTSASSPTAHCSSPRTRRSCDCCGTRRAPAYGYASPSATSTEPAGRAARTPTKASTTSWPRKIRNALVLFRPLADEPGIELRLHDTVLYNSIYRADDELTRQHPHLRLPRRPRPRTPPSPTPPRRHGAQLPGLLRTRLGERPPHQAVRRSSPSKPPPSADRICTWRCRRPLSLKGNPVQHGNPDRPLPETKCDRVRQEIGRHDDGRFRYAEAEL